MANPLKNPNWLVADIGATNSRCAVLAAPKLKLAEIRHYRNAEVGSLQEILTTYVAETRAEFSHCALAVAAPVDGDLVCMPNRDWNFRGKDLASVLGVERVQIVNDFHAIAYGLPHMSDHNRVEIGSATQYRAGNIAVLGPGSGLGMSAWIGSQAHGVAMCGEGGHITVSGRNDAEDAIIEKLRQQFGHCSAERILSGPGLISLHSAMHGSVAKSSEEITANPDDRQCAETLRQFFDFLGSVAADLALITGASGGLYIAGGIVPTLVDRLQSSGFRARFEDKNRYSDYMRAIPTWVITDPFPGLTGLARWVGQGS